MNIFSGNNLGKSFNDEPLFESISIGINEGERIGIIGRNGAGKTTLLRIIAGMIAPDEGTMAFNKEMTMEYLEQVPDMHGKNTAMQEVLQGKGNVQAMLERHADLCSELAHNDSDELQEELAELGKQLDAVAGWDIETEARTLLQRLGVPDELQQIDTLSGGLQKRVAIAKVLLSDPDLLILDEPTNHLDADSVQWLQDFLQKRTKALLLITHDRYFLDAVSNKIVELEFNKVTTYPGNYEEYLVQKEANVAIQEATNEHIRSKLRTELEWLQRGVKARRTKQKSRVDWIQDMQASPKSVEIREVEIEVGDRFLGSRVIETGNLTAKVGDKLLFTDFTWYAKRTDRIGIIGPNGSGKSTLLRILAGHRKPDDGWIRHGQTVQIGYFSQEIEDLDSSLSVLGAVREIAEYIDTGEGRDRYISAPELLDRFLFPRKRQKDKVGNLSGGEKRRLALLRILMRNPNVLLLDEPTNDLDLPTLSVLEEYLQHFKGCLVTVSHDRSFLDKTVNTIFAFEKTHIKEYPGNYSHYLEKKEQKVASMPKEASPQPETQKKAKPKSSSKSGLSYKEQKEFEGLEGEIESLEVEIQELEQQMQDEGENYEKVQMIGQNLVEKQQELNAKFERWSELGEKQLSS